jgi:hypothetical protein
MFSQKLNTRPNTRLNTVQNSSNVNKQMQSFFNSESAKSPQNKLSDLKEQKSFDKQKNTCPLNKSSSIEYHFSDNKESIPYTSVEIPIEKIKSIFKTLKEKFGDIEIIKEYSIYKNNDLILTVYPDGSSFCSQVTTYEIKDPKISSGIIVMYNEKNKISNDIFPCQYIYNSILDVIDIIFNVNKDIKIVLSTIYENNRNISKVKNIESLGRPVKLTKSKNAWCELYVKVECDSKVEEVHDTINFINLFFPTVSTSQA